MNQAERLYGKLVGPIEDRLVRTTGRILREPEAAADALQETLCWVWTHLSRLDRQANPQAYILRVCVSRCYDSLRRQVRQRQRERPLVDDAAASNTAEAPQRLADEETGRLVRDLIGDLPGQQAKAVLLRLVDEADYAAMAAVMGCSPAAARSHYCKGRAKLQRELARRGFQGHREGGHDARR